MNMFAKFDEIPAMTFQDIKERNSSYDLSRYQGNKTLRPDACTDARTDSQRENSIPTTIKVWGGV